jgi:hypothetical protein
MKRNLKGSFIINLYSMFRNPINKTINHFFDVKLKNVPAINFYNFVALKEYDFRNKIMSFPYKWDPLGGLVDFTFLHPKYFFWKDLPYGRDCDDFAYMWYLYHILNGRKAWIYIVTPDLDIKKAHAICVADKTGATGLFEIFDYGNKWCGEYIAEAMDEYWFRNYKKDGYETISYGIMKHPISIEEAKQLIT